MSNNVELNNIIKKAKIVDDTKLFLIKCNLFEKAKIPIKQTRKVTIFVTPFPIKKAIGKQKNNMFSNLKFISEKFLEETKGIFCI